ncbi:MAG TPA: branched-chain amino acid ABC transporter permease, partial [Firmicutes bacterium]|nr:branched-chain amino acid ABC transporter permease [Bacillota bacterium]
MRGGERGVVWKAVPVILAALVLPRFLDPYDLHVLILAVINCTLAVSLNFSLGYVGQPNFGQALFFGLGAYTSAILSLRYQVPFIV